MTASPPSRHTRFREIGPDRAGEFLERGLEGSLFFPHRVYYLPKGGPDAFKLAERMCGGWELGAVWEVVLYAEGPRADELPSELFFDDDVIWHRQQFGRKGQIATANVVLIGRDAYTNAHVSDLVQRISRRRELRARVERLFEGWAEMLMNAVVNFAVESEIDTLFTPTAALALDHADRSSDPTPELYERIYDRCPSRQFAPRREGHWWAISIAENGGRVVVPRKCEETVGISKTICICHDVERGFGHVDTDPAFAARAEAVARGNLEAMLAAEARRDVRATYSVVGAMLGEVRDEIASGGHALAFHSFDHTIECDRPDQLRRCREVDSRLKGYRLPQSRHTPETTDRNLLHHNFEWLATTIRDLKSPVLVSGLVKVPLRTDDYALFTGDLSYENWERMLLERVAAHEFTAFGLHDCYGQFWLPFYDDLLCRLQERGELKTVDAVAAESTLCSAG